MTFKIRLFCVYILFISCKSNTATNVIDPTWVKLKLPNGWTIYAPPKFRVRDFQGIDSQPGYILSSRDSISLTYDSGTEFFLKKKDCDFSKEVADAKFKIMNQEEEYAQGVTTIYNLRIDTIDNKVAIVKTPKLKGKGKVSISLRDCSSGAWIRVSGEDFNTEKEQLVISIFKTIKLE